MGYRLGVDVGGTFTDLLLFNTGTRAFWRHRTRSTPYDSCQGIVTGLEAIRAELRAARPTELPLFNDGPDIATLRANCLAETGLPAAKPPLGASPALAAE